MKTKTNVKAGTGDFVITKYVDKSSPKLYL